MNEADLELVRELKREHQRMLDSVYEWSLINSGSSNLQGLTTMHQTLKEAFEPLADEVQSIGLEPIPQVSMQGEEELLPVGQCLWIKKRPELTNRILLCGHMDTVFSQSHPFQTPQFIDDNTLNGPGVTDMKGGLCVILHALKAFEQSSVANNIGWDVFINADEEIGSPASGPFLENIASQYQCALVYEPAMTPEGTLAYERKGSGKFTLTVQGVAAHAGRDFDKGRNAISHLAKLIVAVDKLNGQRDDLTINIGLISGGSALNMVPDMAVTKLDVRYKNAEDKPWLMMQLKQLVSEFNQAGEYEVQLHGNFGRPAKTVSPHCHDLFETIRAIAKSMGLTLDWKDSGGCCDGNNLALSGIPVVDTLGVRGGNIHSSEEYLLVDSLVERAQLSSLLLMHLAKE